MKKPIVAANWKMNDPPQGWDDERSPYRVHEQVDVIVFPSLLDVHSCLEMFLTVGAQYGRPELKGAFTGDVSMAMLAHHGCKYVLCGHSERRLHHAEQDETVAQQAHAALDAGLMPIMCIGETADQRAMGQAQSVIEQQLKQLTDIPGIIAYEPVWAIGTGNTATPDDAQQMHAFIRSLLPAGRRESAHILYGGSVKAANAAALIAQPDIDGFLVGGASLEPDAFRSIVDSCSKRE